MNQSQKNIWKFCKSFGIIVIADFMMAFAIAVFVASSGIIMGGFTGVSLIITHYFPSIPLSVCVFFIDLLFFIIGSIFLGKTFAINTAASTFIYPVALWIFQNIPGLQNLTNDLFLCAVLGSLLLGCAVGLIDKTGGSSGGTDIIALIINKYTHIQVGTLLYIIDGCILLMQILFSNTEQILYGIIFLIIQTLALNKAMLAGKTQIQIMIISNKTEEIKQDLLSVQDVGATIIPIEKGFTGQEGSGIICITSRKKVHSITEMIKQLDPLAFITIHEVNEVHGVGFTYDRIDLNTRKMMDL